VFGATTNARLCVSLYGAGSTCKTGIDILTSNHTCIRVYACMHVCSTYACVCVHGHRYQYRDTDTDTDTDKRVHIHTGRRCASPSARLLPRTASFLVALIVRGNVLLPSGDNCPASCVSPVVCVCVGVMCACVRVCVRVCAYKALVCWDVYV
jgi:hypothetical protein